MGPLVAANSSVVTEFASQTTSVTARIPSATYRLQLHRGFTFADARGLVEYFNQLGISDCYISPLAQARSGSLHCYDVVDHRRLNPEIGGEQAFREFALKLRGLGMGVVSDTVPNHVCIADRGNAWWFDVLENGPSSPYASYFDIDWHPPKQDLSDKVLLPVLAAQYGHVLENQEITIIQQAGAFAATYGNMVFPLAPRTWTEILEPAMATLTHEPGEPNHDALELASIITALNYLPLRTETDLAKVRERQREKEITKQRLAALIAASPAVRSAIEKSIADLNGTKGVTHSFDRLEKLLDNQAYRLSFWGVAADEINYRRFFDVNELAAIRVELPEVFAATHELPLRLIREGLVTGLRIDHVDGLRDPQQYLDLLQRECARALAETGAPAGEGEAGSQDRSAPSALPFYVVVEKILGVDESLRADWPVYGTTGYEFLNDLNELFVEPGSRAYLEDFYARFSGRRRYFRDVLNESKKLVLRASMSGEQNVLSRKLDRISEQHRWSRDFTLNSLGRALAEMIACFPVYRSYVSSAGVVSAEDQRQIEAATAAAKKRNPALSKVVFDFVAAVLLLIHPDGLDQTERDERLDFALRFQQLTAPAMAKGFEDTALYRYYPLASLNEVGNEPTAFGIPVEAFHARNQRRLRAWPHALSATSTHDTKRSEDVRARINVLSEIAEAWEAAVERWHQMTASARTEVEGIPVPDGNEEYLLYQTLIGAWPLGSMSADEHERFVARIQTYMQKATHEAKLRTSWINPNEAHDRALASFITKVLQPDPDNTFLSDFKRFRHPVGTAGMLNSLSQTLLKIGSPGIPDLYQGNELWDDSLVDPDNRRPIDFALRQAMLEDLIHRASGNRLKLVEELLASASDGRIKMYVTRCALLFRREYPDLFGRGSYVGLTPAGERARHTVAFARCHDHRHVIIAAGRFFMDLGIDRNSFPAGRVWSDATLALPPNLATDCAPAKRYLDLFTGRTIDSHPDGAGRRLTLAEVFAQMPIAMLVPSP
ncbi:MAG TPA: malto-oligosyltrehalose synthase [Candidatus Binataceae bacterium]|nr:malto-oligosyltrehalose synthase [Candidatus Binataceae bacterium]